MNVLGRMLSRKRDSIVSLNFVLTCRWESHSSGTVWSVLWFNRMRSQASWGSVGSSVAIVLVMGEGS